MSDLADGLVACLSGLHPHLQQLVEKRMFRLSILGFSTVLTVGHRSNSNAARGTFCRARRGRPGAPANAEARAR